MADASARRTRAPWKAGTLACIAAAAAMAVPSLARAASLNWDANGTGAGQTDGAGTWLNANQWWDAGAASNATWNSGTPDSAVIGNGGAGGAITVGAVTAGTVSLNNFTGTYTLQGTGTTLTQSGITIGASAGNVTFRGTGTGASAFTIAGAGGITMNGSGVLNLRENLVHSYTGATIINAGTVMIHGSKAVGNFRLNNGMLTDYFQTNPTAFTSGLGAGDNQVQIYGDSGFGGGNGTSGWRIGGTGSTLVWGSLGQGTATGFFNPSTLKFLAPGADNMGPSTYGQVTLDNKLDLNSGARTVSVAQASGPTALVNSWGRIDDGIIDSGSGGSFTKSGLGNLIIAGTSSYTGGTTISQGALRFDSIASMPSSGNVQVSDGAILGVRVAGAGYWTGGTSGVGTLGGLIAGVGGAGTSTVSYSGNVGLLLDVTATTTSSATITNAGATSLALHKMGTSQLTLSGDSSYSGGSFLYAGTLTANHANALGTSGDITFRGGTLQYAAASAGSDYGSRIKNSASAITLDTNSQNVSISGMAASNTGGLTKNGAGILTFTGTNSYTGATTINAGQITLNNGSVSGSAVTFAANNTTLRIQGGTGVSSTWNNGNGNFGTKTDAVISNAQVVIDGDGVAGSAVLTNVNQLIWGRTANSSTLSLTNGGQMNVNGEVRIGNPYYNELGGANVTIGGGTATSTFTGNTGQDFYIGYGERTGSKNNSVTVSSGGVLTSVRDMYVGHVNQTQNNDNPTTNNQLLVSGGTASMRQLSVGFADADTRDAATNVVQVTSGGQLSTTGVSYVGRADNATSTSNGNTLTVSGTSSSWNAGNQTVYVGHTNIASAQSNNNVLTVGTGGTLTNVSSLIVGFGTGTETGNQLVVDGSLTATSVTVNAANSLLGTGTIGGTVALNGTLSPGNSPGMLTFGGDLSVNNGASYVFEAGDLTDVNGTLDLNPSWTLDLGAGFVDGGSVTLFTYTTLAASPELSPTILTTNLGFTPSGSLTLTDTGSEIVLNGISVVPEPTTLGLLAMGAVGLLRRRRMV